LFDEKNGCDMLALKRIVLIPRPAVVNPIRQALEASLLYILLCGMYILVSGYFAALSVSSAQQLHVIETIKGIVFVVVTGVLFFIISYLRSRKIRRQEETIIMQEEALLHAESRLVAAMSSVVLAHDLNNMLMALSGLVEGLRARDRDEAFLLTMADEVDISIEKINHLAKRIASTAGRAVPEKEREVDVKASLHELVTLLRKHPDFRSCRVVSADIAPLVIVLNRILFEEALLNLLINAAQAAGPAGTIEIRLATEPDVAILEIHDNGPGVPDELVGEIFEPCFTTKHNGAGIGLLSVKAFAVACGAGVSVERSPLGGALFRISIPIQHQRSNKSPECEK